MKQKKTILLWCMALVFLAVVGVVFFLCKGCDAVDAPPDPPHDTATGEQITEDVSAERDTAPSAEKSEKETDTTVTDDGEKTDEGQAPSTESTAVDPPEPESSDPEAPTQSATEAPVTEPEPLAYEVYQTMSAEEQEAYFSSFSSVAAFFEWYNAAKDKYLAENPGIEIGPDGSIPIP